MVFIVISIIKNKISWDKNKQWLHLLSFSNTPLFISCTNKISNEQRTDIMNAYKVFNIEHNIKPIDIYKTKTPSTWKIDGEIINYNW